MWEGLAVSSGPPLTPKPALSLTHPCFSVTVFSLWPPKGFLPALSGSMPSAGHTICRGRPVPNLPCCPLASGAVRAWSEGF